MDKPTEIYLDMDGVLADFASGMVAHGHVGGQSYFLRPKHLWTAEEKARDESCRVIMARDEFWPSLEVLPGAMDLLWTARALVGARNVFVLTALPANKAKQAMVAQCKRDWLLERMGISHGQVITCQRSEKQQYARPNAFLVDDLPANCAEWADVGGVSILHRDPVTSAERLRDYLVPFRKPPEPTVPPASFVPSKTCGCDLCAAARAAEKAEAIEAERQGWNIDLSSDPPYIPNALLGSATAAERKATPVYSGVLRYFPDAIAEVARVSKAGNDQHNPGQPLHWSKGKSTDHDNCIARHLLDAGTIDTDGQRHRGKVAWRALASLQIELEAEAAGMTYEDYIAKLEADYA